MTEQTPSPEAREAARWINDANWDDPDCMVTELALALDTFAEQRLAVPRASYEKDHRDLVEVMYREKKAAVLEARRQAMADVAPAWEARGIAWSMVRDAFQELGPVGALDIGDSQGEPPDPILDAERLIAALQKTIDKTRQAAIEEAAHFIEINDDGPNAGWLAAQVRALADQPSRPASVVNADRPWPTYEPVKPMSDTPIINAAIRAGCCDPPQVCTYPKCQNNGCGTVNPETVIAALRAAHPWKPPTERIEAMARAIAVELCDCHWDMQKCDYDYTKDHSETAIAAYHADPLMHELYPVKS